MRPAGRARDDAGGVWIRTGWACGVLLYAFIVVLAAAGFTVVLPLVVVPPVLVALIGANSLLGGGRARGRSPARPRTAGGAPLTPGGPPGTVPGTGTPDGAPPGGR